MNVFGQDIACTAGAVIDLGAQLPTKFLAGSTITCPSADGIARYCDSLSCGTGCNPSNGDCIGGKCYCGPAWTGSDCNTRVETLFAATPADNKNAIIIGVVVGVGGALIVGGAGYTVYRIRKARRVAGASKPPPPPEMAMNAAYQGTPVEHMQA